MRARVWAKVRHKVRGMVRGQVRARVRASLTMRGRVGRKTAPTFIAYNIGALRLTHS